MGNAIRFLKNRIAKLPLTLSESEAKSTLLLEIDQFINENIILADRSIVKHAVTKLRNGDVLLTYGSSSAVEMILLHAHELGKQFHVVVVDSRPKLEGQLLLRRLVKRGLHCTYSNINAISYIMQKVLKFYWVLRQCFLMERFTRGLGVQVLLWLLTHFECQAYKFHERVQLDSICSNELGDPDAISKVNGREDINYLDNLCNSKSLQLLNLVYYATPSDYVSMIITDYGIVPPTSVPVIMREYKKERLLI